METAKLNLSCRQRRKTQREAAGRRDDAGPQAGPARAVLAEDPRLRERERGPVPRSQVAGEALDHATWRSCSRRSAPLASPEFIEDATRGFANAPMSVRVSPYLLSLIDWSEPVQRSAPPPVHPAVVAPLARSSEARARLARTSATTRPSPGLTHRYADKALFLPLDTCPVYCRFCTRSYAVGIDTEEVEKFHLKVNDERWQRAFAYIASRPELEDIVISGGDAYNLRAEQLTEIGETLLAHAATSAACASPPRARRSCRRRSSPTTRGPTRSRASSSTGASCTRRSCCTRTSTTRTRSPASPKTR